MNLHNEEVIYKAILGGMYVFVALKMMTFFWVFIFCFRYFYADFHMQRDEKKCTNWKESQKQCVIFLTQNVDW